MPSGKRWRVIYGQRIKWPFPFLSVGSCSIGRAPPPAAPALAAARQSIRPTQPNPTHFPSTAARQTAARRRCACCACLQEARGQAGRQGGAAQVLLPVLVPSFFPPSSSAAARQACARRVGSLVEDRRNSPDPDIDTQGRVCSTSVQRTGDETLADEADRVYMGRGQC